MVKGDLSPFRLSLLKIYKELGARLCDPQRFCEWKSHFVTTSPCLDP